MGKILSRTGQFYNVPVTEELAFRKKNLRAMYFCHPHHFSQSRGKSKFSSRFVLALGLFLRDPFHDVVLQIIPLSDRKCSHTRHRSFSKDKFVLRTTRPNTDIQLENHLPVPTTNRSVKQDHNQLPML